MVFPFLLNRAVDAFLVGEGAVVAVQRHVAVGHIVAEDEEPHGEVVARRGDGASAFLFIKHLEIVDNAVRNRIMAAMECVEGMFRKLV